MSQAPAPSYYNEIDSFAADWLEELIRRGLIPYGDVDQRPIQEVSPSDLSPYTQCHFFAGIGGWAYALILASIPSSLPLWTGSCPCQPFSNAGQGKGTDDSRHLWPYFHSLISQCRPPVVFGEQVTSPLGRSWLSTVRADLEAVGYGVGAGDLCAASVGAPHIRQRLYWVAESDSESGYEGSEVETRSDHRGDEEVRSGSGSHGFSSRVAESHQQRSQGRGEHRDRRDEWATRQGSLEAGRMGYPNRHRVGERSGYVFGNESKHEIRRTIGRYSSISTGAASQTHAHNLFQLPRAPDVWLPAEFLTLSDGTIRPTQPGIFPLADGIPCRVGRIRGYGNAIVPQLAAEFICAYMETREDRR